MIASCVLIVNEKEKKFLAVSLKWDHSDMNFPGGKVENGETMSLRSWSFDVQLEDLNTDNEECGGHGLLHNDHCHCDSGYQVDPNDSSQCIEA